MAETAFVTDKMAVKETFRVSGATLSELRINQRVLACLRPASGEKGQDHAGTVLYIGETGVCC